MRGACLPLLLLCLLAGGGAEAAPRLALVIANATYASLPALASCAASGRVVGAALGRAGFTVSERHDLTNGEMGAALGDFSSALAKSSGADGLLYVCGYVSAYDKRPFLLPVSADIQRESDMLAQGIVAKSVLDGLRRAAPAAGAVLFDGVALPGSAAPPDPATLLAASPSPSIAVAVAIAAAAPPQGATPLAAALAAGLAPSAIEAGALVSDLTSRAAGAPQTRVAALPPAAPAWLVGGPAPATTAPAAVTPPAEPAAVTPSPPPPTSPSPQAAAPPAAPPSLGPDEDHMNEAARRQVQAALLRLGYYDGTLDGVFGPETRAAMRRFQHEIGAPMTGRLTPEQAGRLLAGTP